MQKLVSYKIDGAPTSVNKLYATLKNGRRVTTKEGRAWKTKVKLVTQEAIPLNATFTKTTVFHIYLKVFGKFLTKKGDIRLRDADNIMKPTLDAIADTLGINDAQIFKSCAEKIPIETDERYVEVEIFIGGINE